MMSLHPSAQLIQDELRRQGSTAEVRQLDQTTRSAHDAASAVGCQVGQIVKSLVFRGTESGAAILVLTSGANRVDEAALGARLGEPISRAEADFVRQATGFAIGGVPPFGHPTPLKAYFDEDLLDYATVWAAAGTPNAVFEIEPGELQRLARAEVVPVKPEAPSAP